MPILSNVRNITVKDSTKLGKFCLEHGGHQEKTTGTKKQQQVQRKTTVTKNNRYKLLIIGKWDSAFESKFDEMGGFAKEDEDDDNHNDNKNDNNNE